MAWHRWGLCILNTHRSRRRGGSGNFSRQARRHMGDALIKPGLGSRAKLGTIGFTHTLKLSTESAAKFTKGWWDSALFHRTHRAHKLADRQRHFSIIAY